MLSVNSINGLYFNGLQNSKKLGSSESTTQSSQVTSPGFMARIPLATMHAYSNNISFGSAQMTLKTIGTKSMDNLMGEYGTKIADNITNQIIPRVGQKGQFLNWLTYLDGQIKHVDEIYQNAAQLKKNGVKGKLGLIGIGGSVHPPEAVCSLTGYDSKLETLLSVRPEDIGKFVKKLGNLDEAGLMIVSKSGTTTEPAEGFAGAKKLFEQHFTKKFLKEAGITKSKKASMPVEEYQTALAQAKEKAQVETAKRLIVITDANPEKSTLRRLGQKEGYMMDVISDDVGGRYGAFDNHSLTMLAHNGMPKAKMVEMIEGAKAAQKDFFSTDMTKNLAAQKAAFVTDQVANGRTDFATYYYGDRFKGMPTWETQKNGESLKSTLTPSAYIGTGVQHYFAEADCHAVPTNTRRFFNIVTLGGGGDSYKMLTGNVLDYYPKFIKASGDMAYDKPAQPVLHTNLPASLSPAMVGRLIELEHATTIHTGALLRSLKGESYPMEKALPEVTQPNVELFKANVNKLRNKG